MIKNPEYEDLIEVKFAAALKSDEYMKRYKRINLKINLCIGLMALKLLLIVCGVF